MNQSKSSKEVSLFKWVDFMFSTYLKLHKTEKQFFIQFYDGLIWKRRRRRRVSESKEGSSVTRFDEISPLWRNFQSLWGHFGLVFANFCTYFGNFYATGQIFSDVNGQIVKNNVPIWSQLHPVKYWSNSWWKSSYMKTPN